MEKVYGIVSIKQVVKESEFIAKITSPESAYEAIVNEIGDEDRENFLVVCLNTKNDVVAIHRASIGSLNSAIIHPREVFKAAILNNAASINSFDLKDVYENLSGDWISFALETIKIFFEDDSYAINTKTHSDTSDDLWFDHLLHQKGFVDFLNDHGQNYSAAKMSVYIQRGKIPEPDVVLAGSRYWLKRTCEEYLKTLEGKGGSQHI